MTIQYIHIYLRDIPTDNHYLWYSEYTIHEIDVDDKFIANQSHYNATTNILQNNPLYNIGIPDITLSSRHQGSGEIAVLTQEQSIFHSLENLPVVSWSWYQPKFDLSTAQIIITQKNILASSDTLNGI